MAIGDELEDFGGNLTTTRRNLRELRDEIDDIGDSVETVREALETPDDIEAQAEQFIRTVRSMQFSNKVLEKVGPLKTPALLVNRVLDKVEDVARNVRDKADAIDDRIERTGILETLRTVETRLEGYEAELFDLENRLEDYAEKVGQTADAFDRAGAVLDPVEREADAGVAPLNDLLVGEDGTGGINGAYRDIRAEVEAFKRDFQSTLFTPLTRVNDAFDDINGSLAFLAGPLNAAHSALKPVEGALDLAGLLYDITVGPVVDWVLDTLGISDLMDRVAGEVERLLPDADVLDEIERRFDTAFTEIDGFLGEPSPQDGWDVDVAELIRETLDDFVPGLGAAASGSIRIGTEQAEALAGRGGLDDVLHGLGEDDTIDGLGGDDLLFAGRGDDVVRGGAGTDRMQMLGFFRDWSYDLPEDDGPIVFRHGPGVLGFEYVSGVEHFDFLGGVSFTPAQLRTAVFDVPGGRQVGTTASEYFYAAGSQPVQIFARGGDDVLVGASGADSLVGGPGDDTHITGDGRDTVQGGRGSDTWMFAVDERSGNSLTEVDLATGETWDGRDRDTLFGIENATMLDNRDVEFFGDAGANRLIGNAGEDFIHGRAGPDALFGGAARDLLIGGPGRDTLSGGSSRDVLIAAGDRRGGGETYDGGEGGDLLSYTTDRGYDFDRDYRAALEPIGGTAPLRISVLNGTIEHLGPRGQVIATDRARNVETFIGGDGDDTLWGNPGPEGVSITIDGGPGDDFLRAFGAAATRGGAGDDLILPEGGRIFEGGAGIDTLDASGMEDTRWEIRLTGAIGSRIRGLTDNEDGTTAFGSTLGGVEVVILGPLADEVRLDGDDELTVFGGAGDDTLYRNTSAQSSRPGFLYGQAGDDSLRLFEPGEAYGNRGDDLIEVRASGRDNIVHGGPGDDRVFVARMNGSVDGGPGYDVLTLDRTARDATRLELDLGTGRLFSDGTGTDLEGVARGFEAVVGDAALRDAIRGSTSGERLIGRGGDDTLAGRGADDELFGNSGDDSLQGGTGDDLLHGGAGRDTIEGGPGRDTASFAYDAPGADAGAVIAQDFGPVAVALLQGRATRNGVTDTLRGIENVIGGRGADSLTGSGADNALTGGAGADTLAGFAGDDLLVLGPGADVARGGRGNDTIILDTGQGRVDGGPGFDRLGLGAVQGATRADLLAGTVRIRERVDVPVWADDGTTAPRGFLGQSLTPRDVLEADRFFSVSPDGPTRPLPPPAPDAAAPLEIATRTVPQSHDAGFRRIEALDGGTGDDLLLLSNRGDRSDAGSGADRVFGRRGNDRLEGGEGDDRLNGNAGNDRLFGNTGDDILAGGPGRDYANGGFGADTLLGGPGGDRLIGFDDDDALYGGGGADLLEGAAGRDLLRGFDGADTLRGQAGNDRLAGEGGDDLLVGNRGIDALRGGAGADTLVGGADADFLDGQAGGDTYLFVGDFGTDTILDFATAGGRGAPDVIRLLTDGEARGFAGFMDAATQVGRVVVYDLGADGENVIRLRDTFLADLGPESFAFA